MKTQNEFWKEYTGYTILEWAQYMELVQSSIIEKLLLMIDDGQLKQRQYDEIIDYVIDCVKRQRPDLLPPTEAR